MKKYFIPKLFKPRYASGFTLVELIVVIGVLGVLLAAGMYLLNPVEQLQKTNDSRRKQDLAAIQRALETYYEDHGRYPISTTGNHWIKAINPETGEYQVYRFGEAWRPYMSIIPQDPDSSRTYRYVMPTDFYALTTNQRERYNAQRYYLYSALDRPTKDQQACQYGNADCTGLHDADCRCLNVAENRTCKDVTELNTEYYCNYGVSSPDTSP